ncbi:hypothetical protein [Pseudomonas sp. C9]|uniref:hypothetical protein n=1 Tax=Pseudomonas sp. C9 TaxID=1311337 RepID=UPI000986F1D6|nr:hypothetical protein [Pseudomonas sp. C9]OOG11315.1 hypothetical protein BMS17_04150 [Pseudomonas sp. C9]
MKKKLPNYTLLIAEDVRAEINERFSVMGITHQPISLDLIPGQDHAIHTLSAYGEFEGLSDSESVEIKVIAPNGELLTEGVVPIPKDQKTKLLVVAGKFVNVKFKNTGMHNLSMTIDGYEFSKSFEIIIN